MDNSLFPIRMEMHIVLGMLALLVFGLQFIRYRKSHHLVLAIALPCTLLPYLSDNINLFYGVGIAEFAALVLALLLSVTVDRNKKAETVPEETEQEEKVS